MLMQAVSGYLFSFLFLTSTIFAVDCSAVLQTINSSPDPILRNLLRSALAEQAASARVWQVAVQSAGEMESLREQKLQMMRLAIAAAHAGKIAPLQEIFRILCVLDSAYTCEAGRLVTIFISANDAENIAENTSEKLIAAREFLRKWNYAFCSDQARFDYLRADPEQIEIHLPLFQDDEYRQWGKLALAQREQKSGNLEAALRVAQSLPTAEKRAWCLRAIRQTDAAREEAHKIEDAETRSIILRILGRELQDVSLLLAAKNSATQVKSPTRRDELILFALRQEILLCGISEILCEEVKKIEANIEANAKSISLLEALIAAKEALHEETKNLVIQLLQIAIARGEVALFETFLQKYIFEKRDFDARENLQNENQKTLRIKLPPDEYEEFYFSPFAIDDNCC